MTSNSLRGVAGTVLALLALALPAVIASASIPPPPRPAPTRLWLLPPGGPEVELASLGGCGTFGCFTAPPLAPLAAPVPPTTLKTPTTVRLRSDLPLDDLTASVPGSPAVVTVTRRDPFLWNVALPSVEGSQRLLLIVSTTSQADGSRRPTDGSWSFAYEFSAPLTIDSAIRTGRAATVVTTPNVSGRLSVYVSAGGKRRSPVTTVDAAWGRATRTVIRAARGLPAAASVVAVLRPSGGRAAVRATAPLTTVR